MTVSVTGSPFQVQVWRSWSIDKLTALQRAGLLRGAGLRGRAAAGRCSFAGGGAAQHGLDAFDQQALRERFGDEVVGAHLEPEELVDFLILGGQENHRQIGLLPQAAQKLHAVHARHLDIEDRQLRWPGAGSPSSAEAPSV